MPRSALQLPELWLLRGRFPAGVWRPSPGPPLPTRSRLADSGGSGEPAASGNHESSLWDRCAFFPRILAPPFEESIWSDGRRAAVMKNRAGKSRKKKVAKRVLRLPDLDYAKGGVLSP